ncbi:hypothetical protein [Massilia sp. Root418]|uniref:phosphoribosyltransferase-like protein n=1 Tax=Massilia sp. Root418 TaxID=1736532 RepID=UPI0012F65911|nr:hypothetical protein [Massilia sp. Root418]
MSSNPTFSTSTAGQVKDLIDGTPFLDLSWHFEPIINIKDRIGYVSEFEAAINVGGDFDSFKNVQLEKRSRLSKALMVTMFDGDLYDEIDAFGDIDLLCEFLLQLNPDDSISSHVSSYYSRICEFLEKNLGASPVEAKLGRTLLPLLLNPGLKWREHIKKDSDVSIGILKSIESIVSIVSARLRSKLFSDDLLETQNFLIYCYLVLASVFKGSIHPLVVSEHLLVFRYVSPAAWSVVDVRTKMQFYTLILHLVRVFYPVDKPFKSKLGFSNNTLADLRNLYRDAAGNAPDAPFTTHQWVFRWFAEKLDAEVFSIRGFRGNLNSLTVLSEGEQNSIVDLSMRFGNYRLPVTTQHLAAFLLQFGTTERIRGVLRMLVHSRFFPMWELGASMEKLLTTELSSSCGGKLVIAPLGDQTGSTAIIKYLASHSSIAENLLFADDLSTALLQTNVNDEIYFVDDCLLSGTQTLNILGDLMGTRERKPHHTIHCEPLSRAERVAFQKRKFVFSYCVVTDIGEDRFLREIEKTGIDPGMVKLKYGVKEHSSSKAFEPLGPVAWSSATERDAVKQFSSDVGYEILAARATEKGWDDDRRRESALGYSNFQRLLIFPYNVPKTTLTLLWEHGRGSREWSPLFPGFD